jgi:3-deoxy-D-manno-octulosonic-acid transferase
MGLKDQKLKIANFTWVGWLISDTSAAGRSAGPPPANISACWIFLGHGMFRSYGWLTRFLLLPLLAWLWWRGRREPGYRVRWRERLGWGEVSPSHMGAVWLHAASVGEVQAAQALIERLLASGPDHGLMVITPTGAQALQARWGDPVRHVYAPLDTPGATQRWLARWQPRALVLVERELWPNWC